MPENMTKLTPFLTGNSQPTSQEAHCTGMVLGFKKPQKVSRSLTLSTVMVTFRHSYSMEQTKFNIKANLFKQKGMLKRRMQAKRCIKGYSVMLMIMEMGLCSIIHLTLRLKILLILGS